MVKSVIVLLSIATLAVAATQEARTIREKSSNDGLGNFQFTYELDNGQIFSEVGSLKDDGVTQFVSGAYSFIGPDGQTYWVNFTADENGFHPVIGTGPGGIGGGQDAQISPNALKSLVGK